MPTLRALLLRTAFVLLALTTGVAAQDYPTKPVRILVPFPPGGINDIVARLIGAQLSERLGKQFVVENKTGAGGIIAGETLVNSAKDGHTLMIVSMAIAVNPHMYKMTYDTLKDFAPIAILATAPNLLSVNAELPVKSIKELIALAKAKPGDLKYASSGVGTFMHLGPELFKSMAGVDILHVPFRGAGPALIDVVAGNSQMSFASVPSTISHIRSGKLRGLGVGGLKRNFALPDVPTIDESGVAGYECANWVGLVAPTGTPQPIIDLLHKELTLAQDSPEMKRAFEHEGADEVRMTPTAFAAFIASETAKWGKVVRDAGMKAQ
jgi:tripartite-type tricarboxylate transporter receptor subunit TctC